MTQVSHPHIFIANCCHVSGDAAGNPFNILTAMNQTYLYAKKLWNTSHRVIGAAHYYNLSVVIIMTQVLEGITPCPGVF